MHATLAHVFSALLVSAALTALGGCVAGPGDDARRPVDLIIAGDYLVTMDAQDRVIARGAAAVDDGRILAVGPAAEIDARFAAAERIEGRDRVLMPGLINGHTHAAMSLLRGIADDHALEEWLEEYIFPAEVRYVDAEFVRIGTELACWEFIRGGSTTFVDMYYFPDVIAEVVEDCGLRAVVTSAVLDQPTPDAQDAAQALAQGRAFVRRWKGRSPRVIPAFGPHSNYTLNAAQLEAVAAAAAELGVPMSIHLSESPFEVEVAQARYGTSTVHMLEAMDFFRVPVIGAHVVWPTAEEIPILARRGVGAIHNPTSNMKTAAGVAPVTALLAAGVDVGLGTDGAASNNDLDLWEEMRLAAFLQKVDGMDPEALPARTVLRMATAGGAAAIGLGDQIGSLEPGKRADLIQVDLRDVHFLPLYDVISHLVYVADEQDVRTVVVDGRVLMREGEILTIDTERVSREAAALAGRLGESLLGKASD